MKSRALFQEIITTCALANLQGVVPSLLEYQNQLRWRIEQFCQVLADTGIDIAAVDAMRRLLCTVVDSNSQLFEQQGISWSGYELEHLFYGYQSTPLFTTSHYQLLFNSSQPEVSDYARQLYGISLRQLPGNAELLPIYSPPSPSPLPMPIAAAPVVSEPAISQPDRYWARCRLQLVVVGLLLASLWGICWYCLPKGLL